MKNRVTRILVFKSKPSQEILKIRDGTPWEAEEILTYIKKPSKQIDCHFSTKFDLSSNVVHNKRVARILFFKIRSSQEFLKIRDGTPLEAEEILTYINNVLQKNRVTRILVFKSKPSQEILKIRDGTPWEAEEILTYIKKPSKQIDCHFSTKFDLPSNVVQDKRVARILFFKIRSSQEILKIRDGTPLEKKRKKRVARILFFKIRSSQEILKVRDGTPLEAEEILTYIKKPSKRIDLSLLYQKNRVTRILVFKSKPSQEILKIRDGTPWEAEEILTYIKKPSKQIDCHFSTKFDLPSNVVQDKRVARILFFKIRSSQEILKIRDGTPLEKKRKRVARILFFKIRSSQEILKVRDGTPLEFDLPSNVLQKNRVTRILVFKSKPSQEILKIRDGTPWEAEEILTYIKKPSKQIDCHFSTKFDLPSNVVQNKRVARILFFKIRSSQEFLKIRDGTPLEAEEILTYIKKALETDRFVTFLASSISLIMYYRRKEWRGFLARILFFKIRSSQEILKIRDGTPLEKNRVTRILVFKSKPSQEILKIRDGTPWEAEEILTYIKKPSKQIDCHFSTKFDLPSNVVQNKRVARILFFKIRSSQEFLKIRDGTPLEAEEILTYIKKALETDRFVTFLASSISLIINVLQKKRVARILFFKIRSSQEILKIRDGTPLEAEEILTYIKKPSKQIDCHFSTKFDLPSNVVQDKRVARILFFKIRSSQEILKIRDGTPLEKKRVARIMFFKIRSSQEILKVRDGTPLEAEEILTYIKKPSKRIDLSLLYQKNRVTRILVFKSKPSQEILKIRDGTPWEAEEILTYIKKPSKQIDCHFSTKFDLPSNVVQNKRVARILFFKIRSSQEFLKIRDGTPLEAEEILTYIKKALETDRFCNVLQKKRVARILFFKIRSSQEILKIRDGTLLEAEEILTYIKKPSKQIDCHFSTKFDLPSNVVQDKRVARILFFKIRSSQEILKIRDGTPLEKKRVARILFFKIRSSQEILKIRDGTPLEAEEILTYIKNPRNGSIYHFSTKFDVPTNIVQNKRVARILFFKIRSSQEILKICDGTPLEAEEILTYIK
ncbi:hypothetical protein OROGR_000806 [Orobanche gracilis]